MLLNVFVGALGLHVPRQRSLFCALKDDFEDAPANLDIDLVRNAKERPPGPTHCQDKPYTKHVGQHGTGARLTKICEDSLGARQKRDSKWEKPDSAKICGFLRFPAKICGFLRFSAQICDSQIP